MTKLKQILNEKGIKQNWIADQMGLSVASISNFTSGRRRLPKSKAIAIASILNVELKDVQDEKDDI